MTVTDNERAEWARNALESFRRETNCDFGDSLGDLLCNLMHFADSNNFDFEAALTRARGHYVEEKDEERADNVMNIRCRKCGNADELDIEIVTWARLTSDGTDITAAHRAAHESDDNCLVLCDRCGHFETLGENKRLFRCRRAVKKGGTA